MDRDDLQTDPRQELIDTLSQEMNGIRRKLAEIKSQIEQMQTSVEREQSRYSTIATELRTIQDNLDTTPREDIRDKYDDALNVRFRLATMRGQLEKFEAQYEYLEKEQGLLASLLSRLQGAISISDGDDMMGDMPGQREGTGLNIVRIIQAQEEERQRLARQMHDGPAQSMTNFILQVDICRRLFNRDQERAAEELNSLKDIASQTFQKIREFIFDLRPMMLDDLGVIPTVKRYADSYKEKNDVVVDLEVVGEERRMESHHEVLIFRSIQELMVFARDYAAPSTLRVRLDVSTKPVRILVEDNGRGFDTSQIFDPPDVVTDARIQGMITLKEKIELVGGTIAVESDETSGTRVRLELPFD